MAVDPDAQHLLIESWTLYAIGLLFVAARMYVAMFAAFLCDQTINVGIRRASRRILLGSFKKFQIDDYIMLFIIVSIQHRTPGQPVLGVSRLDHPQSVTVTGTWT